MSNIKPLNNYVLIKMKKPEVKSKGGIILTDESISKEEYALQTGEVLLIGDGCFKHDFNWMGEGVEVGDKIYVKKYSAEKVDDDDEYFYYLVIDANIQGVIKGDN